MKAIFKTALVTSLMGLSAGVMANDASEAFKWVGTVPVESVENAVRIVNAGTNAFDAGTMIFKDDGNGDYLLQDSSTMEYYVEFESTAGADDWQRAQNFEFTVKNMSMQYGGGLDQPVNPANPEFVLIDRDNNTLDLGQTTSITNGDVNQTVKLEAPNALTMLQGGDEVRVESVIVIENATI